MSNPLLAGLDSLTGAELKERFAAARVAAVEAGAQVEADAATRLLQIAMRNAVRAMVKGIDVRAPASAPGAAATIPDPRPRAPMKPILMPPRPPVPAPAKASAAAPKPPPAPRPRWTPPPPPVPPPIDPGDDNIPW